MSSDIPLLASSVTLARNFKSKPTITKAAAPQLATKSRVAASLTSRAASSAAGAGPAGLPLDATRGSTTSSRLVSCPPNND